MKEEAALSHCIYLKLDAILDSVLLPFTIYSSTEGQSELDRLKEWQREKGSWEKDPPKKEEERSKFVSTKLIVRQAVLWLQFLAWGENKVSRSFVRCSQWTSQRNKKLNGNVLGFIGRICFIGLKHTVCVCIVLVPWFMH